ncbi:transcription elongation factor GreB [Anaerobiospirillum sp. NML120511]|nr:transcription elongation factor GreB [Anaerobiospirillum sp. NML120449]MCK0534153.1 transcription elongation factor GreB [Anaerobiospirillum sp. NML120511]MCK0539303.1 transcription elongation factor GreB [Anaerobiospirillum sp. NML02-A-032]
MAKKPYITAQGYELLKKELDYLWLEKRPDVTAKVSWAASLGDRSENADYQYNKRLLAQIDRRIRYLRRVLNDIQVVEFNIQQEGRVFFGAYVEIEADDDESIMQIRIVGGEEIFGRSNYISVDAPMAKALLGKSEGDDAVVHTPKGNRTWYVNKISYKCPQWFTEQPPVINDHDTMDDEDDAAGAEELSPEDLKKLEQSYMSTLVK